MRQNLLLTKSLIFTGVSVVSLSAFSAPGILEDLPLNISTSVQPNILFLLDDSGSMDWEQLISQDGQDAYSANPNGSEGDLSFAPANNTQVNELCLQYNLMAYNPEVLYEPWSNQDDNNDLYGNKTLTTALDNPYITGSPQDLTNHIYMSWVDDDDDVFEVGECGVYSDVDNDPTPVGFTIFTMGADTTSNLETGYLVDSGGESGDYGNDEDEVGFTIDLSGVASEITISFSSFNLEAGYDFLTIYDGTSNAGTELAVLDGGALPASITVNSPTAHIEFDSDGSVVRDGFVLFWNHSTSGVTTPNLSTVDLDDCRLSVNCTVVLDLPVDPAAAAAASEDEINTQQNYANWYTYYRKREYVAKKALSDIIDDSTARLGLATLHNRGDAGTKIENMRNGSRKQELFDNLFGGFSAGGTPLRGNLEQVGEYFEEGVSPPGSLFGFVPNHSDGDTISTDSPIFNATNGGVCQQNFAVVFSDGFWNGSDPSVGDQDSDDTANPYDGGWFADTYLASNPSNLSNTLADVAMRYLKEDLSSTLNNVGNVPDARDLSQDIPHQHLTTYTVAFGLEGTMSDNPSDPGFTGWTDPINNSPDPLVDDDGERIDDMRHAAWNGRGEFLSANDPQELIAALTGAIEDIADRTGTATAASFNSGSISSDTLVFLSVFSTENWFGDLFAYRFDEDGIVDNDTSTTDSLDPVWSASTRVASQSSRNVITYNGTQGVEFVFPDPYAPLTSATLNSNQVSDLLTNAPFNSSTTDPDEQSANQSYGDDLVNYLKGDSSNEIVNGVGLFRSRDNQYLGPFIHSSPQFVGVPSDKYPNLIEGIGNEYSTFSSARSGRTPLVYVGGNDGMVHAFNASATGGGNEVFAYIPSFLVNDLHTLSETDYAHIAYVDATPTIRDVFIGGAWRTYLVGGTRSGGRGIYVLDVTDPAVLADPDNASTVVKFEFTGNQSLDVDANPTAGGDADLGFTYSRPQIAKMNDGSWVAIVANGYNSEGDGQAKLFIINLETGATREIDTGVGNNNGGSCLDTSDTATDGDPASDCNGLSSPTIADLNGDFRVDRIYAGDLHGNMWAFDVSDSDPNNWGLAFSGAPLFTACSASPCTVANRQPITVKPEIISHPSRRSFSTSPNVLVYFGSGQFVAEDDDLDTSLQSFYAVWDAGGTYGNRTRTNLQAQTFSDDDNDGEIEVSNNAVDYVETNTSGGFGWYIDLAVSMTDTFEGGRAVINPLVINQLVLFVVTKPSGDICNRDGDTYLVALDNYDGTEASFYIFDTDSTPGADSSSPVTELNAAVGLGSINSGSDTKLVTTNADGTIDIRDIITGESIASGRKSWSILK